MKHWINRNYKTLIITAFLIPIITVAIVSISHVTQWYGISNPLTWAIYLSFGIEIAAMSALAAISANMGRNVYFPFVIVTLIQFIGNIFFAYEYIDVTNKMFTSWVELVSPLVGFMGVEPTDLIGHKRFLALFAGGFLPIISLSFLHMLVKFTEEDRLKDVKEDEEIHQKEIEEKIKHETSVKAEDVEGLKELIEDEIRYKPSEDDLEKLQQILTNKPNDTSDKHNKWENSELLNGLTGLSDNDNWKMFEAQPQIVNEPDDLDLLDDEDLYSKDEPENDEGLEQYLDEEVSNIIPEPIPTTVSAKVTNPDDGFVQIYRPNQSQGLHPLFSEKYIRPIVVNEPEVKDEEPITPLTNEQVWDLIEDTSMQDHGHNNGLTPLKEEIEPEISTFDDDLMEDYIPMKYEDDYYVHFDEPEEEPEDDEDEPVVGDRYPLEQEPEEETPKELTTIEKIEEVLDKKKS